MKKKQETSEFTKRELRIASLMIDHFLNNPSSASDPGHFQTPEKIKSMLPSRVASTKTIISIADKADFFKINDNQISLASSEIETDIKYKITGAIHLFVNGKDWSIDGGTRTLKLPIPQYNFEVMAEPLTPLGDWTFTALSIKTVFGQVRRQVGDGKGRGNNPITINTTA
jgi:hypothetical protein